MAKLGYLLKSDGFVMQLYILKIFYINFNAI